MRVENQALLLLRHGMAEHHIHLFPDDPGAVVEDMAEGLVLPMQIAHEMLGALGQVEDGAEIDDFGAHRLNIRILRRQQPEELERLRRRTLRLCPHPFHLRPPPRHSPSAARSAPARSVFSHGTPRSSRPRWP